MKPSPHQKILHHFKLSKVVCVLFILIGAVIASIPIKRFYQHFFLSSPGANSYFDPIPYLGILLFAFLMISGSFLRKVVYLDGEARTVVSKGLFFFIPWTKRFSFEDIQSIEVLARVRVGRVAISRYWDISLLLLSGKRHFLFHCFTEHATLEVIKQLESILKKPIHRK